MKAYRFRSNQSRPVPVRWHDQGWVLTLDTPAVAAREREREREGQGQGQGQVMMDEVEEMKPMKARFPIAMGRTISQPSRDPRHRR